MMKSSIVFLFVISTVVADIYFHNPRGSNDRLDSESRDRTNNKRLFNSENNARGGYNVGNMQYYAGSTLKIEWTNQHSCGGPNNNCEVIIQYMCHDKLRDGITEKTIPDENHECLNHNCNEDYRYGMHEDHDYYTHCSLRERNKGLFTADQELKGNTARYTRQNAGGTQYGYECSEEREYYPYWHPTEWRDIVVMTNDIDRCEKYKTESQNVKSKFYCKPPDSYTKCSDRKNYPVPISEEKCKEFRWPYGDPNGDRATWMEVPSFGLDAPECILTKWSRDNHLGNGKMDPVNPTPNTYDWKIPDIARSHCALRARYNISTNDYDSWDTFSDSNGDPVTKVDIASLVGLQDDPDDAENRGYVFQNNPVVSMFKGYDKFQLRLAINTAQFGRTFQDRSHDFAILERPADLGSGEIVNVNVRGKRGNIVQVYPAVEYDFVPNIVSLNTGDYIHFQWTGSNTNNNGNAGQGLRGSDRSNVVLLHDAKYIDPASFVPSGSVYGHLGSSYPMSLKDHVILGLSHDDGVNLALLRPGQFGGELSELDDAGTYFNMGLRKVTSAGTYYYMCTRNNNFSNRSQKGTLIVTASANGDPPQDDWVEEKPQSDPGEPVKKEETSEELEKIEEFEQWPTSRAEEYMRNHAGSMGPGYSYASDFYVKLPAEDFVQGKSATLKIKLQTEAVDDVVVYHSYDAKTWHKIHGFVIYENVASLQASKGGFYVARRERHEKPFSSTLISGVALGIAAIAIIAAVVLYFRQRSPSSDWKSLENPTS